MVRQVPLVPGSILLACCVGGEMKPIIVVLMVVLIVCYSKSSKLRRFKRLRNCGFDPKYILDVGANKGDWTQQTKEDFPGAQIFMIEGDSQHVHELKPLGPFEIALVSEMEKNVTFYARKDGGTGNTLFKENSEVSQDRITRTAYTIDSIVKKNKFGPVDFLKLDIQGSEVNGLRGATETLKTVDIIKTETSVMNFNQGAPTFAEMIAFMDSIGFAFYQLLENIHDGKGVLIQLDGLFVRKTSKYWSKECTGYPAPAGWQK